MRVQARQAVHDDDDVDVDKNSEQFCLFFWIVHFITCLGFRQGRRAGVSPRQLPSPDLLPVS